MEEEKGQNHLKNSSDGQIPTSIFAVQNAGELLFVCFKWFKSRRAKEKEHLANRISGKERIKREIDG
jgi:hypothetical protein